MAILAQLVDDVVVHKFELVPGRFTLGRHPDNSVVVDDSAVSAMHAVIEIKPNEHFSQYLEYFINDVGSTNGTYINNEKIVEFKRLHNGDVVRIAWNQFKFIDDAEADLEKTVQMLQNTKGM